MTRRFALPLAVAAFLFACHLGDTVRHEEEASFPGLYDSLKRFDHAVIVFSDGEGRVLDTVFEGPVDAPSRLLNLPIDNWDGGLATIRIYGYLDGKEVYAVEKRYDGATGRTVSTLLLKTPEARLTLPLRGLSLFAGDSLPLPSVTVIPAHLADTTVTWTSADPAVARVAGGFLQGHREGATYLTARLAADSTKTLSLLVLVEFDARIPERITVAPETLSVATGGAPVRALAKAHPASAAGAVRWKTDDPALAVVDADGTVRGLRPGRTRLRATSAVRGSVEGAATVVVTDSVPVQSVRFRTDSTRIYLGGTAESLLVAVHPPAADPEVRFTAQPAGVVTVAQGRIVALAEGTASLVVSSRSRPTAADTLAVRVLRGPAVDSLRITPRTLTLYMGGEAGSLEGRVYPPSSPDAIRWVSTNPNVARIEGDGRLLPVQPGHVRVLALSAADSLVKDSLEARVILDAPVVDLGADTVLKVGDSLSVRPVVAPQAYGLVTTCAWDLDGDLAWDDSAAGVQAVSRRFDAEGVVTLRVLVRDSEGNETVARKQVRVVTGPVVRIHAPADGSHAREARVAVRWSIDDLAQASQATEALSEGLNLITRSAPDGRGGTATASVLVILDTTAPPAPAVTGPAWVRTAHPAFTFASSGSGAGVFRCALDGASLLSARETHDTVFVPEEALSEGPHTLAVEERDGAGNWSPAGRHTLRVDLTPPASPTLRVEPGAVTNLAQPTVRWQGGGGGMGLFQIRLGAEAFGAPTPELAYTPGSALPEGEHVVEVRERDSAGHWSAPATVTVTVDRTAPERPHLAGPSPTGAPPRWTWISGGGGSGDFRFKVGGDGNPANGGVETRSLEHVLTGAVTGMSYTLFLQERDAAGNWSAVASHPIVYDPTRPAVTLRAPQASGTYRTRLATVDIVGVASKPEGGAPIQSLTYTLDGVAGTLPTQLAADGTWAIRSLPLQNEKTLEFKATATDGSGNTGEAILFLAMDSTPPPPPVFTAQPPAVVNAADTRTFLSWAWTHSGAPADSFVVRLNGQEAVRQTATTFTVGNLTDGAYAVQVLALDLAGNSSPPVMAGVVTVARTAPPAPNPTAPSPTRDNTPTWTWTAAVNASFEYRLALGAMPTGPGTALPAASHTPGAALTDGTWHFQVRARDAAGNWSPWSLSSIVVVKAAAPRAPTVVRNAAVSNAPRWTWEGGGGGNGIFRYRWSGAGSYLGEDAATAYAPTGLSEQAHSLCVSERDTVGFGAEACQAITVDRTPPVLEGYSVADGFITNRSPILIRFTRDGTPDSLSCALTDGAATDCRKAVTDAAGNGATASRTVWYRSNVVFVKEGGAGARDGSSWADAYPGISTAIFEIREKIGRVEIWVSEGVYGSFRLERSRTSIYGGFRAEGNPSSNYSRDPSQYVTRVKDDSVFIHPMQIGWSANVCQDAILDGIHVRESAATPIYIWIAENVQLKNIWLEGNRITNDYSPVVKIDDGSHRFDSIFIRNNYSNSEGSIEVGGGNLLVTNSEIFDNRCNAEGLRSSGVLTMSNGRVTLRTTRLQRNVGVNPDFQAINSGEGILDIDECIVEGLRNGVYPREESPRIIWGSSNSDG